MSGLKEDEQAQDGAVHLSLTLGSCEAVKELEPRCLLMRPMPKVMMFTGAFRNSRGNKEAVDQADRRGTVGELEGSGGRETKCRVMIDKLVRVLHREVRYT